MKFCRFLHRAAAKVGLILEDGERVISLEEPSRVFCKRGSKNYIPRTAFRDIASLSKYGDSALDIASKILQSAEENKFKKYVYNLNEVKILPPVGNPSKIICAALNFEVYREQLGFEYLEVPMIFLKSPTSLIGHMDPIEIPIGYGTIYHEWELACIIGSKCYGVSEDDAEQYIFGYTILDDITGHDLEMKTFLLQPLGKNMNTFAPLGPFVVTPDQVGNVNNLRMVRRRNGVVESEGNTSQMRFKMNEIIAYISTFMTLNPGDVISGGSPPTGPIFPGDVIEAEIENIGVLKNPVVARKVRTDYAKRLGLLKE